MPTHAKCTARRTFLTQRISFINSRYRQKGTDQCRHIILVHAKIQNEERFLDQLTSSESDMMRLHIELSSQRKLMLTADVLTLQIQVPTYKENITTNRTCPSMQAIYTT